MKKLCLSIGFLLIFGGTAMAKTPDGLTPSVETVCDDAGLKGAARGLCNAYCEAMDCDSYNTRASDKACEQVSAAFSKKTGGMDMPCEAKDECPCYSGDDLMSILISVNGDFDCASYEYSAFWYSTNSDFIAEFGVAASEGCWQHIPEDTDVEISGITETESAACIDIITQYCQPQPF